MAKRNNGRFSIDELNNVIDIWEKISEEYNGKLEILKTKVDARSPERQLMDKENKDWLYTYVFYKLVITIPHNGEDITITTSESRPPIFEFPVAKAPLQFSVSNEDYVDKILKLFGSDELQIGDKEFDKKYLLETDNKIKLSSFLDSKIRDWLSTISICYFDLNTPKSKNKLSIHCTINELSADSICESVDMFKYCINRLME
ncbi:MAG: hypothetical protein N4A72_02250 [Bacteroidales bacterium]|jgi:hypothetical protein|nr:hypothetical protein [Bacteroidales bacterium]